MAATRPSENLKCERCGLDEPLVVHHRNRDRTNNSPENIEILCANCHYKEHGIGRLNANAARKRAAGAKVEGRKEHQRLESLGLLKMENGIALRKMEFDGP